MTDQALSQAVDSNTFDPPLPPMQTFSPWLRTGLPCLITAVCSLVVSGNLHAAAPTGISLNVDSVIENLPAGTLIGTLSAVDPDPGGYHSFSFVPEEGSFNDWFVISGNQIFRSTTNDMDFETDPEIFSIRLSVIDNTGKTYQTSLELQLLDDRSEDADHDGLSQADEEDTHLTSDLVFDSDSDGIGDGTEVTDGTLPTDPTSWNPVAIIGWGRSFCGELLAPPGTGYSLLMTGENHSLAIDTNGGVTAWGGQNSYGQISVPAEAGEIIEVAAGGNYWLDDTAHSLALKSDGTLLRWGYDHYGKLQPPEGLQDIVSIGAGRTHCIALKNDGTVITWGENPHGDIDPTIDLIGVIDVAASGHQSLALINDGTVAAWGSYFDGTEWIDTTAPAGLSGAVGIACGRFHSLALKYDGTIVAWGYNSHGQTDVPTDLSDVVAIAAGGFHSLALKSDGSVVSWGSNIEGQTTTPVSAADSVTQISAGLLHSLAIRPAPDYPVITSPSKIITSIGAAVSHQVQVVNGGTLPLEFFANGLPDGLTIDPASGLILGALTTAARRPVLIRVKTEHRTLTQVMWIETSDGSPATLITLTPSAVTENSPSGTVIGSLAATDPDPEDSHTFELVDGPGSQNNGLFRIEGNQLIVDQTINRDYEVNTTGFTIRVRARDTSLNPYDHVISLPLLDDRSEDADGDGLTEQQEEDEHLTLDSNMDSDGDGFGDYFETIRGSSPASPAVTPTGRMLIGWGRGDDGRTLPPADATNIIDISAGGTHTLALNSDGSVISWGGNSDDQASVPAELPPTIAVESGGLHSLALHHDGTVSAWGNNQAGQTDVPPGLDGVVAISAGAHHNLALRSDGTVTAWGYAAYGQIKVPPNLSNVVSVAAGGAHSLALKSDGTIAAWGSDWGGATIVPEGLNGVIAIAAGAYHCLALKYDGTVVAWGFNDAGQSIVPEGLNNITAISAGWKHSLALRSDGSLVTWGNNTEQVTEIPLEASNIRMIEAGNFHSFAIRQDSGFPAFANISPARGWPGETFEKTTLIQNAAPNPTPGGDLFSAMGLPADLEIDPASGTVTGLVLTGERRAVRLSADTDQGMLDRVIWFDTADGVPATQINLSSNIVKENSVTGTLVGTVSALDPNAGDSHTFRLETTTEAPDSLWFTMVGNNLIVRYQLGADYDLGETHLTIRIIAIDSGGNSFAQIHSIALTDDPMEDGDGDGVIQSVEEEILGTNDSVYDDLNIADSDGDGVPGIIEYAFNLSPTQPNPPLAVVPGEDSIAGLPSIEIVEDAEGEYRLRMEYLRRIGGEMIYYPQFSSGIGDGYWQLAAEPTVTPIDAQWQRCVVMDSVSLADAPRRFGRVGVKYVATFRMQDVDQDGITQALEEDIFGTSDGIPNDFKTEDMDHDTLPGIIEYAFNLEPRIANPPTRLVAGAGSVSGLPAITLATDGEGQQRLRVEFVRRVGSILSYAPQFTGGLGATAWQSSGNLVSITAIDDEWERCIVEDSQTTSAASKRFARVAVSW